METVIKSNASVSLCESASFTGTTKPFKIPSQTCPLSLGKNKATWLYLAAKEAGKRLSSQWGPPPHTLPPPAASPSVKAGLPSLYQCSQIQPWTFPEHRGQRSDLLLGQILDAVCGQHAQSEPNAVQVCSSHVLHPRE